jgi:hypothetical protein
MFTTPCILVANIPTPNDDTAVIQQSHKGGICEGRPAGDQMICSECILVNSPLELSDIVMLFTNKNDACNPCLTLARSQDFVIAPQRKVR